MVILQLLGTALQKRELFLSARIGSDAIALGGNMTPCTGPRSRSHVIGLRTHDGDRLQNFRKACRRARRCVFPLKGKDD
jgi:hypothetical protein